MKTENLIGLKALGSQLLAHVQSGKMFIRTQRAPDNRKAGSRGMCSLVPPITGLRGTCFFKDFVIWARKLAVVALLPVVVSVSVCAQELNKNAIAAPASLDPVTSDLYRIGSGDVLEVRVFNRPQLSREAVRVDNGGLIRMPMIDGEIRAVCRTEAELANEIATLYLKYQRRPHVDVFVKEYSSKPVAVIGAVEKPGQFHLQRRMRLLELVSLAGGPTERAGERLLVTHGADIPACEQSVASTNGLTYNLNHTLKGEDISNPYVRPGDIITIPEAQQAFVVGNVFKPSSISLKEKITVSQAVAMAGGTMTDARKNRIHILRQLPGTQGKTEIVVDLDAISKRKAEDIELQPNDIVEVPTSAGKRFLRNLLGVVAPGLSSSVRAVP